MKNEVHQDDGSTTLSDKNSKMSLRKSTCELNIRCIMMIDQKKRGNTQVECFLTVKMMGDCVTKCLQGIKFSIFRKKIMGME